MAGSSGTGVKNKHGAAYHKNLKVIKVQTVVLNIQPTMAPKLIN